MINNIELKSNLREAINVIESKYEYRRFVNFEYRNNEGKLLSEEEINEQEWLDNVQTVLDYAGIVPVIGDAIDVINAVIYFARAGVEGKFMPNGLNGLFSVIAVIPVVGSALSIPIKALFNAIPVGMVTKIVETLFKKSGSEAAEMVTKEATTSTSKKVLSDLISFINKNIDTILKGTKALKTTFKALAVIPFTKVDDKLAKYGVQLITKLEDFLQTLGKKASKEATSTTIKKGLKFDKIPSDMLTKRGRIATKGFGFTKAGHKRMFYASQDMFSDYLKKEGRNVLTKEMGSNILNQTIRNLNSGRALSGETIEQFIKRVGEDKFTREFTNLSIVNQSEVFEQFLKSSSFKQRGERFLKTITDPSVIKDATGWYRQSIKSGFKALILWKGKSKPSKEDYREKRRIDRNQKNMNKKNSDKKGGYYGTKREM
jgi:hypothetical protein